MESTDRRDDYKCKLCFKEFGTICAVLQHELSHMVGGNINNGVGGGIKRRKAGGKPQFWKRHRKGPAVAQVEFDEILAELQDEVRGQLLNCPDGSELNVLCRIFQPEPGFLAQAYNTIVNDLHLVLGVDGGWNVQAFGSTVTGMAFKDSDIDFYLTPNVRNQPFAKVFNRVNGLLSRSPLFGKCFAIRGARVPIIKCTHEPSGINIDINMSSSFGVHNSRFISKLFQYDQRIHPFMLILKIWAKCWCITKTGRMTNYTLILLVVFYLQSCEQPILPPLKNFRSSSQPQMYEGVNFAFNENMRSHTKNRNNIRTLLREFFEFYADFDFASNIVCPFLGMALNRLDFSGGKINFPEYTRQMEIMLKRETELKRMGATDWSRDIRSTPLDYLSLMVVQDPFCLNNNTAKSVSTPTYEAFKRQVAYAAEVCSQPSSSPGELLVRLFYEQPPLDAMSKPQRSLPIASPPKPLGTYTCRLAPIETELFFVRLYLRKLDSVKTYEKQEIDKTWTKFSVQFLQQTFTDLYKMKISKQKKLGPNNDFHVNAEMECSCETWQLRKFDTKKGYALFLQEQMNYADMMAQLKTSADPLLRCRLQIDADTDVYSGISITVTQLPLTPKNHLSLFFKDFTSRVRSFLRAYFEKLAMETKEVEQSQK